MKPIRKSMIAVAAFLSCAVAYALEVSSGEAREAVAGHAAQSAVFNMLLCCPGDSPPAFFNAKIEEE